MTKHIFLKLIALLLALPLFSGAVMAMSVTPEAEKTYQDIQKTWGTVPAYLKSYPQEGIESAWEMMKIIPGNSNTAISGKYKELIGLGVAAQIPCNYCTYFHTEVAKLNGATDNEIQEAIAVAADTRFWSTWINGMQIDEAAFKTETNQIMNYLKQQKTQKSTSTPIETQTITTAQMAYQDIEKTLGVVPQFMRMLPEEAVAPAWRDMKSVYMSPNSAIPQKYKDLIGLGVAAQIPCNYCIYFHTESAKLNGATAREIAEAVFVAANTRKWSTVLNGSQINEVAFKKESDQIMKFLKKSGSTHVN